MVTEDTCCTERTLVPGLLTLEPLVIGRSVDAAVRRIVPARSSECTRPVPTDVFGLVSCGRLMVDFSGARRDAGLPARLLTCTATREGERC